MKRNDEVITPDGYIARVLLCAGAYVTVVLIYAHVPDKYRTYTKWVVK